MACVVEAVTGGGPGGLCEVRTALGGKVGYTLVDSGPEPMSLLNCNMCQYKGLIWQIFSPMSAHSSRAGCVVDEPLNSHFWPSVKQANWGEVGAG